MCYNCISTHHNTENDDNSNNSKIYDNNILMIFDTKYFSFFVFALCKYWKSFDKEENNYNNKKEFQLSKAFQFKPVTNQFKMAAIYKIHFKNS